MIAITGYINVYRNSYFHCIGSPNSYDRCAGDIYPTLQSALNEIAPGCHYIGTTQVIWEEETMPHVNSPNPAPPKINNIYSEMQCHHEPEEKNEKETVIAKVLRVLQRP